MESDHTTISRNIHTIASILLRLIQGQISSTDERLHITSAFLAANGNSEAHRDRYHPFRRIHSVAANAQTNPFSDKCGILSVASRQNNQKLLSPVTTNGVIRPYHCKYF